MMGDNRDQSLGQSVLGIRAGRKNPRESLPYLLVMERPRVNGRSGFDGSDSAKPFNRQTQRATRRRRGPVQPAEVSRLQQAFGAISSDFPKPRVLVIGDLILDHYVWGRVSRISPEAPGAGGPCRVRILEARRRRERLQQHPGAGRESRPLRHHRLGRKRPDAPERVGMRRRSGRGGVVIDQDRPTTRKSRVIAHNQQIVRYDVERRAELKPRDATADSALCRIAVTGTLLSCGVGLCQGGRERHADVRIARGSPRFARFPSSSIRKSNTSATTRGRRSSRRIIWKRHRPPVSMAMTIRRSTRPARSFDSGWDANPC